MYQTLLRAASTQPVYCPLNRGRSTKSAWRPARRWVGSWRRRVGQAPELKITGSARLGEQLDGTRELDELRLAGVLAPQAGVHRPACAGKLGLEDLALRVIILRAPSAVKMSCIRFY